MSKSKLPYFLQDFHDQKDIVKAFYVWLEMRENVREHDDPEAFRYAQRRNQMCNWANFQILMLTFLDFLGLLGWQLYRSRRKDEYPDLEEVKRDLLNLRTAWICLTVEDGPQLRADFLEEYMKTFSEWFEFMPEYVKDAWNKRTNSTP